MNVYRQFEVVFRMSWVELSSRWESRNMTDFIKTHQNRSSPTFLDWVLFRKHSPGLGPGLVHVGQFSRTNQPSRLHEDQTQDLLVLWAIKCVTTLLK